MTKTLLLYHLLFILYTLKGFVHKNFFVGSFDVTLACDDDDQKINLSIIINCLEKDISLYFNKIQCWDDRDRSHPLQTAATMCTRRSHTLQTTSVISPDSEISLSCPPGPPAPLPPCPPGPAASAALPSPVPLRSNHCLIDRTVSRRNSNAVCYILKL